MTMQTTPLLATHQKNYHDLTQTTSLQSSSRTSPQIERMSNYKFREIALNLERTRTALSHKYDHEIACCVLKCPILCPCMCLTAVYRCTVKCIFLMQCDDSLDELSECEDQYFYPMNIIEKQLKKHDSLINRFLDLHKYVTLNEIIEEYIQARTLTEIIFSYQVDLAMLEEIHEINRFLRKSLIPFPDELQFTLKITPRDNLGKIIPFIERIKGYDSE